MPGGQVEVVAGRHQRTALHAAAIAKQRHHALKAQLLVEVGTANVHTAGGEDVALALGDQMALGRQADQGEVRGTTADVDDQYQLFAADARLIVEGRGNRLVLERHVLEADFARHFGQGVLGLLVGSRVFVDEEHRAAQHHLVEFTASGRLSALLELADEHAQQVLERQGAAQHAGVVLDQLRAQQAFQRAHQAAFVAFQVLVQRQAAIHRAPLFDIEEHHRGQGDLAVFQGNQRLDARPMPTDCGVGGAKVDAQGAGRGYVRHGKWASGGKTAAQCMPVGYRIKTSRLP
ncbi:Uncharacterised protein [Pseudomonas putida]|nr:Uncharacterised protein [Pseudomonas putida]